MGIITPTNKTVTEYRGLHLYHFRHSNCSMRVRMTLEEKGLEWTSHHVNLHTGENVTPEYFGIHPKGLVPTLVHDGVVIVESTDIIDYLDKNFPDPPLQPEGETGQADSVARWMRTAADNHIHVKTYMFAHSLGDIMSKSDDELAAYRELQDNEELLQFHEENSSPEGLSGERVAESTQVLLDCFAEIDRALDGRAWLTGDAFTLADITWIPLHVSLDNAGFPFHRYANVARWKDAVHARPSFERAVRDWTGGNG
ncbi:MAG: glutathione S-transferase family protein [Rhodospirillales bacterium]|nr:glutathione S-transferase family protein [Rhodospirillales bacterium]